VNNKWACALGKKKKTFKILTDKPEKLGNNSVDNIKMNFCFCVAETLVCFNYGYGKCYRGPEPWLLSSVSLPYLPAWLTLPPLGWKQQVLPKCWYLLIKLCGVTFQKTVIFVFAIVRTLNLTDTYRFLFSDAQR
jgi:hypothetical protein